MKASKMLRLPKYRVGEIVDVSTWNNRCDSSQMPDRVKIEAIRNDDDSDSGFMYSFSGEWSGIFLDEGWLMEVHNE